VPTPGTAATAAAVGAGPATLAALTTLRVGGPVRELVDAASESEIVEAVRTADEAGTPVLVLGGGSNLVISDEGFDGVVVRDTRRGIDGVADSSCAGANVVVPAGQPWDEVVATAVAEGWMGVEALSGIPGSTGATPVQNVGAYGQEVAETLSSVRVYDRLERRTRMLAVGELGLGYRTSVLKRSLSDADAGGGRTWGPTGRYVVLEVTFQLRLATLSAPVRYAELARRLDVAVGGRVPAAEVREAVLELRRGKGMVLDDADHDTWSAGSFFTNPVLTTAEADAMLPEDAPRFPVTDHTRIAQIGAAAPVVEGLVKSSAAWLISRAGFDKGFGAPGPATLSTKHSLALTNRGSATAADLLALARTVRDGVRDAFGVTLVPEPVLVGVSL
jgi:UDP-N-acetylmuramate dehydrogenase